MKLYFPNPKGSTVKPLPICITDFEKIKREKTNKKRLNEKELRKMIIYLIARRNQIWEHKITGEIETGERSNRCHGKVDALGETISWLINWLKNFKEIEILDLNYYHKEVISYNEEEMKEEPSPLEYKIGYNEGKTEAMTFMSWMIEIFGKKPRVKKSVKKQE